MLKASSSTEKKSPIDFYDSFKYNFDVNFLVSYSEPSLKEMIVTI